MFGNEENVYRRMDKNMVIFWLQVNVCWYFVVKYVECSLKTIQVIQHKLLPLNLY